MLKLITICFWLLIAIMATSCANKVEVPKDINVHSDPVKVEISPIMVTIVSAMANDPKLQETVTAACQADPACVSTTTNDLLASLASSIASAQAGNAK